jgi:hypothetical protein
MSKNFWLVFLLLLAVGFAVFGNSLGGDFVYDDNLVLSHSFFGEFSKTLSFFGQPYFEDYSEAGLYRPLTQVSFALNFLFGKSPFGFHLTSILLHILNSALVFLLVSNFIKSRRLALFASFLFLVLPIHVEAVSSIVGRAELLSFLFSILALLLWLKGRPFWSSLCFFSALLSKETAIVMLAILLVLSLFYFREKGFRWIFYYLAFTLGYFVLRVAVLGQFLFNPQTEFIFNPLKFVSPGEKIATAFKILILYVRKIFAPFGNLSPDYSFAQIGIEKSIFASPLTIAGLILFVVYLAALVFFLKKKADLFFVLSLCLLVLPWLLISNLVFPTGTIMAERLMYLPSLGAILVVIFFWERLGKNLAANKVITVLLSAAVFVYAPTSISQNSIWASEEKLFAEMYKKSPNSVAAKTYWARVLLNKGETSEAEKLSREAYGIYPDFVSNLNLLAEIEKRKKNLKGAGFYLERAAALRPLNQETLTALSRVYFSRQKYRQANRVLEVLVPRYGGEGNIILFAVSQIKAGDYRGGIDTIRRYFGENPGDRTLVAVLNYGNLRLGNLEALSRFYDAPAIEREFAETTSFFTD